MTNSNPSHNVSREQPLPLELAPAVAKRKFGIETGAYNLMVALLAAMPDLFVYEEQAPAEGTVTSMAAHRPQEASELIVESSEVSGTPPYRDDVNVVDLDGYRTQHPDLQSEYTATPKAVPPTVIDGTVVDLDAYRDEQAVISDQKKLETEALNIIAQLHNEEGTNHASVA